MSGITHHEKLFVDLVVSALRRRMDHSDSDWPECSHFDLPDATSNRIAILESQVAVMQKDLASVNSNMQLLVNAMGLVSIQPQQQLSEAPVIYSAVPEPISQCLGSPSHFNFAASVIPTSSNVGQYSGCSGSMQPQQPLLSVSSDGAAANTLRRELICMCHGDESLLFIRVGAR